MERLLSAVLLAAALSTPEQAKDWNGFYAKFRKFRVGAVINF